MPEEQWDHEAIENLKLKVLEHFERLAATLSQSSYLVGDEYSLADLCYVPFIDLLPLLELSIPEPVRSWIERLLERPSSAETKLAR